MPTEPKPPAAPQPRVAPEEATKTGPVRRVTIAEVAAWWQASTERPVLAEAKYELAQKIEDRRNYFLGKLSKPTPVADAISLLQKHIPVAIKHWKKQKNDSSRELALGMLYEISKALNVSFIPELFLEPSPDDFADSLFPELRAYPKYLSKWILPKNRRYLAVFWIYWAAAKAWKESGHKLPRPHAKCPVCRFTATAIAAIGATGKDTPVTADAIAHFIVRHPTGENGPFG